MIDIKKHYYNMGNEDINMMLFGDLHYSDKFNDKKQWKDIMKYLILLLNM